MAFLAASALFAGSACRSYSHYRFLPAVHEIEVRAGDETVLARILVSPRGILSDDTLSMHFRLRVENRGDAEVELLPEESQLYDAALTSFGPARIERETQAPDPGTFLIWFPFPPNASPGAMDLRTLHLRLGVRHGDRVLLPSANFERGWDDPYYHPYGPYYSVGIGYWYCF